MTPEPAQPAESPEAMLERARQFLGKHTLGFPLANDERQEIARIMLAFAASTARPTERGAVERDRIAKAILDGWYEGNETWDHPRNDMLRLRAYWAADAVLALPATDQAAEVERVEFIARVLWADGQRRLKQGQSDLPRTRTDFRTAARALLDHPALATQPATGRTMGGEDGLREACERLLLAMTTRALRGRDHVPSMRDEQDAAHALRAALQNGGE